MFLTGKGRLENTWVLSTASFLILSTWPNLSICAVSSWQGTNLTSDILERCWTHILNFGRGCNTLIIGVSNERRDGEKQAAVGNSEKRPLEPLTFCSCLKSSSCSTENQSIQVLISNQKSVMAPPVILHVWCVWSYPTVGLMWVTVPPFASPQI